MIVTKIRTYKMPSESDHFEEVHEEMDGAYRYIGILHKVRRGRSVAWHYAYTNASNQADFLIKRNALKALVWDALIGDMGMPLLGENVPDDMPEA